jgi:hypothetical protein
MAKATKKSAKSTNGQKARKPNKLHDTLVRLPSRPNGATITDISGSRIQVCRNDRNEDCRASWLQDHQQKSPRRVDDLQGG